MWITGTVTICVVWSVFMGIFRIGEPFKNIQDYADYPHNRLYFHGKIIGKSVTDNWQYRMISRCIKDGSFLKAELNPEYRYYNIEANIQDKNYDDTIELQFCVIARSVLEAKSKATLKIINDYHLIDDNIHIKAYTIERMDIDD